MTRITTPFLEGADRAENADGNNWEGLKNINFKTFTVKIRKTCHWVGGPTPYGKNLQFYFF